MKYCVYCHTNKINGKKYIGITKLSPQKRWQNGEGYRGMIFGRAIKKYGWDAFLHEILYVNLSKDEACTKEVELIKKYRTCNPKYGYNQSPGGSTLSESARKILSKKHSGRNNPMYGKPRGKNNLMATRKPVICLETGTVYESVSQASKMTGINLGHIASTCNGKRKSAGGFHWNFVTIAERESSCYE